MLPDEIILLVCKYLHSAEILYSFFNLNFRLNSTIADFCYHVNIKYVTYKQFDFIMKQIIPQISLLIRSFVINGLWENISNTLYLTLFHSKLSFIFPQLYTLSLVNFSDMQLNLFLKNITDLSQLVKLDIRNFRNEYGEVLLEQILATNNNRLKSILFDADSSNFILPTTGNSDSIAYPNIEQLVVELMTTKTLVYLFTLVPNINRLHIDFHELSYTSKSILVNISSLVHLTDFQLCPMNKCWSLDEIVHIL
ncbi:unnamed protein product, partial [Rotaria sp. Silwood2]